MRILFKLVLAQCDKEGEMPCPLWLALEGLRCWYCLTAVHAGVAVHPELYCFCACCSSFFSLWHMLEV